MPSLLDQGVAVVMATRTSESPEDTLRAVHRWVSAQVKFVSDWDLFGVRQRTVAPETTLALGRGDCEDFVSTCRTLAVACGVDDSALQFDYCFVGPDVSVAQPHCILLLLGDDPLVVDQMVDPRPLSRRPDLFNLREIVKSSFPALAGDSDPGLHLA